MHMKQCKRVPLECINKCGIKDVPREEVCKLVLFFNRLLKIYNIKALCIS